jgi:hypothetical protein
MTTLASLLDLLPAPYTAAADSTLAALLETFALEFDAIAEDLDRLRRTHWINQAYRFEDAAKLGALLGIPPLDWETLDTYRARLLPLAAARIDGALAPGDIRQFVLDYLRNASDALESVLVLGLPVSVEDAFSTLPDRPLWRPLALVENPVRDRRSDTLLARGGLVPVLFRWSETNHGLDDTVVTIRVTGLAGRRTAVPLLVNLTTGDMILYAERVLPGAELEISPVPGASDPRHAQARLDGSDVTHLLHSLSGVALGTPFTPQQYDTAPLLPRLARGQNDWIFLSVGLYDAHGLDRVFYALADGALREVLLDQTAFDHSLFPSGPLAQLSLAWTETEPASFEVQVPRAIVSEPAGSASGGTPHELAADALERAISDLHAGGVRAALRFMPFAEIQPQVVRHTLPWLVLDSEHGSPGIEAMLDFGGRFDETGLGKARFE